MQRCRRDERAERARARRGTRAAQVQIARTQGAGHLTASRWADGWSALPLDDKSCVAVAQSCLAVRLDTASAYSAEASTHGGKSRALFSLNANSTNRNRRAQTPKLPSLPRSDLLSSLSHSHAHSHTRVHTGHTTYQHEPQGELTILRQRVSRLERGTCGPGTGTISHL